MLRPKRTTPALTPLFTGVRRKVEFCEVHLQDPEYPPLSDRC
jgi:hypothetical protein